MADLAQTRTEAAASGDLLVVGFNHRSAGALLRERLFVEEGDLDRRLAELQAAGFREALLLSTCDRVEAVVAGAASDAAARLCELIAAWGGLPASEVAGQSFALSGEPALRHLFAVAASLDSQVIGEPQVLGQVKEAHRRAQAAGLIGARLEPVLRAAYGAAKRIRSETPIAAQPVTLAASALRVARDLHGDLARCAALVVGLGEMGELLAGEMKAAGLGDLAVTHARERRAEAAAQRLHCHLRRWEELERALAMADIVIAASGTGRYVVTVELARRVLKARRRKPVFFIDVAVPGDIEPAVGDLDGAFVYDLDDLERIARRGKETRESAARAAWTLLDEELAAFQRARAERAAVPSVVALRGHLEALRRDILADGRHDAETATRLLVNRLLHEPSRVLRQLAAEDPAGQAELHRLLAEVFGFGMDGDKGKDER